MDTSFWERKYRPKTRKLHYPGKILAGKREIRQTMFTGIIESLGSIESVEVNGTNKTFWVRSPLSPELRVDQSVSHNGACLTVEEIRDGRHRVTAIGETLRKTNLEDWKAGDLINLERCLAMNDRLDGHLVQGHVDTVAKCLDIKELQGSWEFRFEFPGKFAHLVIEKGSISLNGISLTIFHVKKRQFSIAVIPYTYDNTNIKQLVPGDRVNLEFDVIGKYVARITKHGSKG
jgi:riboflavin synthase